MNLIGGANYYYNNNRLLFINYDCRRLMTLSRVIKVDGVYRICYRDKVCLQNNLKLCMHAFKFAEQ